MVTRFNILTLFVLTLSQTGSANPLPDRPSIEMPEDNIFHSSRFPDTDQVCAFMYRQWIPTVRGEGQQSARGVALPVVISSKVRVLYGQKIEAECQDFRNPDFVEFRNGPGEAGELQFSEKFYLQCNPETEEADSDSRPSIRATHYTRLIGVCRSRAPQTTAADGSVEIKAGGSACTDVRHTQAQALEAFLMRDDDDDNTVSSTDALAQWLNIVELGTSRQAHNTHQSMLRMAGDPRRPRDYRACAKLVPGLGNARLYFVSRSNL